jgi:hypothetical protein
VAVQGTDFIDCKVSSVGPIGGGVVGDFGFNIDGTRECTVQVSTSVGYGIITGIAGLFGGLPGYMVADAITGVLQHDMSNINVAVQAGYFNVDPVTQPQTSVSFDIDLGNGNFLQVTKDATGNIGSLSTSSYGTATGELSMFNAFNLTTGVPIVQANPTNMLTVEQQLTEQFNVGSLTTPFYNTYTSWVSGQLVNTYGGFSVTPILDSIGWGLSLDPIGAFYDSRSPANDPALSIANKTAVILNTTQQGMSVAGLTALDTNHDNQLSGTELGALNLWTESNENGLGETGEIQSLAQAALSKPDLNRILASDYGFYTQGNASHIVGIVPCNEANWRMAA